MTFPPKKLSGYRITCKQGRGRGAPAISGIYKEKPGGKIRKDVIFLPGSFILSPLYKDEGHWGISGGGATENPHNPPIALRPPPVREALRVTARAIKVSSLSRTVLPLSQPCSPTRRHRQPDGREGRQHLRQRIPQGCLSSVWPPR